MFGLVTSHRLQTETTMNTASLRSAGEVEEYAHACTQTHTHQETTCFIAENSNECSIQSIIIRKTIWRAEQRQDIVEQVLGWLKD